MEICGTCGSEIKYCPDCGIEACGFKVDHYPSCQFIHETDDLHLGDRVKFSNGAEMIIEEFYPGVIHGTGFGGDYFARGVDEVVTVLNCGKSELGMDLNSLLGVSRG